MKHLEKYLFLSVRYSAILLPVIVISGIFLGGPAAYAGLVVVFGYYFLVELILWASGLGVTTTRENEFQFVDPKNPSRLDHYGVAIYAVMQIITTPLAIVLITRLTSFTEMAGGILSFGVMAGSVGGLAGHEYIHRRNRLEHYLGVAVYACINYGHFTISHLHGHHRNVGLHEDWSTSRLNETSFHFLKRALFDGYFAAWRLSAKSSRMRQLMIGLTATQAAAWTTLAVTLGIKGVLVYGAMSLLSFSLMEMVNYLSHYGLMREKSSSGKPETVKDRHSWESNNKVTNWFIFNAGKHCHHHRVPGASHVELELSHEKEYLPYGLPLLTLIGFIPPLYFRLMNPMLLPESRKPKRLQVSQLRTVGNHKFH